MASQTVPATVLPRAGNQLDEPGLARPAGRPASGRPLALGAPLLRGRPEAERVAAGQAGVEQRQAPAIAEIVVAADDA